MNSLVSVICIALGAWQPSGVTQDDVLDAVERLCRFAVQHQDASAAFIDPILGREFQYATPYLAYAIGTLIDTGRATDLLDSGRRAMDHSTGQFAAGKTAIPDNHGEFFIAPLADALALYEGHVDDDTFAEWRRRLSTPIDEIIEGMNERTNNWRTYAMKGEWARYRAGLVSREDAVAFIEDGWLNRSQRERVLATKHHLYQDWNGDPQSHAVEAVGRVNLMALLAAGYDGPSAREMKELLDEANRTALLLQDPAGQCPPNGRTDNHVFNDILYALGFALSANDVRERDGEFAGQYRRAAVLGFQSIDRWWRTDPPWENSLSITKNFFDPAGRVGYQPASQYSNYTGASMYHLAELAHLFETEIEERTAPCESGGFTVVNDYAFGSAALNAGGTHVFLNLRGDYVPKYGVYWTPLGIVRLSRPGWDSRLGPSDGVYDAESERGITLAPTWPVNGRWIRLSERARDYRGVFTETSTTPDEVKARVHYAPVTGVGGSAFNLDLTVSPDGVVFEVTSPHIQEFGLTLPVLVGNGRDKTTVTLENRELRVRFKNDDHHELVYQLREGGEIQKDGDPLRSAYGDLQAYRATSQNGRVDVHVQLRQREE